MTLDSELEAAAPLLAPRTPALKGELSALVDAATTRPRRRARRPMLIGGAAALVLGATVATTAAAGPDGWTSWMGMRHKTCESQLTVTKAGPDVGDGEPNKWAAHPDYARRDRMVADAKRFLADFDYASIDHSDAVRAWKREEDRVIAQGNKLGPGEAQPRLRGDALTSMAIRTWVLNKLSEHLTHEGYDMSARRGSDLFLMNPIQAWRCK